MKDQLLLKSKEINNLTMSSYLLNGVAEVVVAEESDARCGAVAVGYQSSGARVSGSYWGDVTSCASGGGDGRSDESGGGSNGTSGWG